MIIYLSISIALICSDATRFQWLKLNHKQSLPSASLQDHVDGYLLPGMEYPLFFRAAAIL
jgi:hypothetical protein